MGNEIQGYDAWKTATPPEYDDDGRPLCTRPHWNGRPCGEPLRSYGCEYCDAHRWDDGDDAGDDS